MLFETIMSLSEKTNDFSLDYWLIWLKWNNFFILLFIFYLDIQIIRQMTLLDSIM